MTDAALLERIASAMEDARGLFYRLVVVLQPEESERAHLGRLLAERYELGRVNVGLELGEKLMDLPARQRPLHVGRMLEDIAREVEERVIVLENIEILFEVSLKQEPLRLLQGLSRSRIVVAIWSGTLENGNLIYAVPGHPEYRSYPATDLLLVDVEGIR
jgi:hypothetical protein